MGSVTNSHPLAMAKGGEILRMGYGGGIGDIVSQATSNPLVDVGLGVATGGGSTLLGQIPGINTIIGGLKIPGMPGMSGSPLGYMLGSQGGINGTGIDKIQGANIQQGVSAGDVQNAQNNANNSLASQNALLAALQGQNGLGQQNAVAQQQQALAGQLAGQNGIGNQTNAMSQQQGLNSQLAAANGIGTQNSAIGGLQGIAQQQQAAANMYGDIAQGRGPNPAQAMLNQQTGANVANQAALMAGQRGAGANIGLMARQAAQQGAATQQQAVGQGATMQANQQLGALSGLTAQQQAQAGTQQAIGGLGTTQAGMQQSGISQQAQQAAQQVAEQQAQQNALAQQANVVAGQQMGGTTAASQAALANAGQLQGALGAQNQAAVANQGNINSANASLANTAMQGQQKLYGGLLGGASSGAGAALGPDVAAARGGEVHHLAYGSSDSVATPQVVAPAPIVPVATPAITPPPVAAPAASGPPAPKSAFGQFLTATGDNFKGVSGDDPFAEGMNKLGTAVGKRMASDDKAPEGEVTAGVDANNTNSGKAGLLNAIEKTAARGGLAKDGGHVAAKKPSQKPVKGGNSYDNDKVPAMLSEGEIVLPRSVTMGRDPVRGAAQFVQKVLATRKAKAS